MTEIGCILNYLETAYSGAKMADDAHLMTRLSRAIVAFSCDEFERTPSWEEMQEEYIMQGMPKFDN